MKEVTVAIPKLSSRWLKAKRIPWAPRLLYGDCHTFRIAEASTPVGVRFDPEHHFCPPRGIRMVPVPSHQAGTFPRVQGYGMSRIFQSPVSTYIGDVEFVQFVTRAILYHELSQRTRS